MSDPEEICLEIDGTLIPCKKQELMENSDYFKVMFEGNFAERHQNTIALKDVDLTSMNIILTLLWDDTYSVSYEDILLVLQTACMLQFEKIRRVCIERVTEILSPENCLKIWQMTEPLDLKPLYLKAKSMALTEFPLIKDMDSLCDLNLKQLCFYLSSVKLNCLSELDVFTCGMKWYYENLGKESPSIKSCEKTKMLMYFLSCVDFKLLSDSDIKEMMTYPDISDNGEILRILTSLIEIRTNVSSDGGSDSIDKAKSLLSCRSRVSSNFPCLVVDCHQCSSKRQKMNSKVSEVYVDKFKRKRKYILLESKGLQSYKQPKYVFLYNDCERSYTKFMSIPQEKHANLKGFHMLGYKELIFLFGGEFSLGRGIWNVNFWVYDTVRERWERKTKMPYGRRHFESCISRDILYIVGGTGSFRVIQDNMFWYNYKENEWSKQIILPCIGRQVKCCDFNNQLLLLNVNIKCGYLFDLSSSNWIKMDICDSKNLVNSFPEEFTIFSYNGSLYIKGSSIIEIKLINSKLEIVNYEYLKPIHCDSMESVICGDILYTIYKHITEEHTSSLSLEKFCMKTYTSQLVLEYENDDRMIELDGEMCTFTLATKLFGFKHFSEVAEDTLINDFDF